MKRFLLAVLFIVSLSTIRAQYSLTVTNYSQDFNGLGTGNSSPAGGDLNLVNTSLNGWFFAETGANSDGQITVGNGVNNAGDTYNFGATANADRKLGGLRSGSLVPYFGFYFTNNTGNPITSLAISYTGETWRIGTAGRLDRLDFQYSTSATTLTAGTWSDFNALDYEIPAQGATGSGTIQHTASISATITGLNIAVGTTFFIRWFDLDATGADDGMAIENFNLTASFTAPSTDFFRSFQTGDWNNITTWESSPTGVAGTWVAATATPASTAQTISIRNGHTVSVTASVAADQVVIESGGILNYTGGTFTIDNGSGDDVAIQNGGVFVLTQGNPAFGSGAEVNVNTGGILRVAVGGITGAGAGVNSNNYVYQHQSVLEYTLNGGFSSSNVTYFPNVSATTIPIFRVTASAVTLLVGAGAPNNTTFNGVFEISGTATVRWQNSANRIFRNGIRNNGTMDYEVASIGTGKFIINGTTAELGGTDTLFVPPSGLDIGPGTTVTMVSNKIVSGNITLVPTPSLIDLGNFDLTVTGTITNTDVASYVRTGGTGALTLNNVGSGAAGKLFPVGRTSINPVFISSGTDANFSARVVEPITPPINNNNYAVLRTWYLESSVVAPTTNLTFGYSFPADCGAGFTNTGANVEVGFHIGTWNLLETSITPAPFLYPNTFTVSPANTFSGYTIGTEIPFAIANNGAILPLDYRISARSQKQNNTGIIQWEVFSTDEVRSFEVQRSAGSGAFETIAVVNPASTLQYSYTDRALQKGTNLYRVKVNRLNGAPRFSNTVAVISDTKGLLITAVSPNPVPAAAVVTVSSGKAGRVMLRITDLSGQIVKQRNAVVTEGTNRIDLPVAELPGGTYLLQVSTAEGDSWTVTRFVKQ